MIYEYVIVMNSGKRYLWESVKDLGDFLSSLGYQTSWLIIDNGIALNIKNISSVEEVESD